ncbi:MAG TPA: ammonium transporter [Verrucomicrobiales bacterium]|nr:ammonium transporter [Verrucomicrobiales bacterium]
MKKLLLTLTLLLGLSATAALAQDAAAAPPGPTATEISTSAARAAAAAEVAGGVAEDDQKAPAYLELLESQGEYGYAFDFFAVSMLWTVIAAALVFIMHLGFATLEAGLTQAKNTVNILFKNVFIICMGLLTYALWGFVSHYPGDGWLIEGFFAFGKPIGDLNADGGDTFGYGGLALAMTGFGDFIFQAMFAATAATIVSGAVAERVKLAPFLIFSTLLVGIAYPWVGSWHWGGGWMGSLNGGNGFKDFAGSAVVHAFGGFAALGCVLLLGPRHGKYVGGKIRPIPGHNMPLATIGVFLLFLGWFGFNGGSVLSAAPGPLGLVVTTTALAAAAGGLSAAIVSWMFLKKPDLSMALNGILAGLVGITANADIVSPAGSIIIGLIAGIIVFFSVLFFDKIKIDDPVGAISVHGVCGVWGILAAALFDTTDSGYTVFGQLIGVVAVGAAALVFSLVVFGIIKVVTGIRVSEDEEAEGLDIGEHGQEAYHGLFATAER